MTALGALLRRDLVLAGRAGGGATGVAFLLGLATLVPFAVGPDLAQLQRIGPAILWIGALLSVLLGLERLFTADLEDGSLDLLRLGTQPLELVVLTKAAAHWLTACLPIVIAAPCLGLLYAMSASQIAALFLSLLAGTPALVAIGASGAAATVGVRRGGVLLALIVLPLSMPVLIFGTAAAQSAGWQPFALLGALSLASVALSPFAAAAALRTTGE